MTTFFLAGIIQGSLTSETIHAQDYRERLKAAIRRAVPDAHVYCPVEHHPQSLAFSDEHARRVFFDLMGRAARADVLIAYLPEASMGTAIEMWNAHHAGKVVLCISPMTLNWVVKFLSDRIFESVDALEAFLLSGQLVEIVERKRAK
jgi:hypothetical protein